MTCGEALVASLHALAASNTLFATGYRAAILEADVVGIDVEWASDAAEPSASIVQLAVRRGRDEDVFILVKSHHLCLMFTVESCLRLYCTTGCMSAFHCPAQTGSRAHALHSERSPVAAHQTAAPAALDIPNTQVVCLAGPATAGATGCVQRTAVLVPQQADTQGGY